MSELTDLQADLLGLEQFRDWLESLVAAQQPIEEWSLSLEELKRRWSPAIKASAHQEPTVPRLYF